MQYWIQKILSGGREVVSNNSRKSAAVIREINCDLKSRHHTNIRGSLMVSRPGSLIFKESTFSPNAISVERNGELLSLLWMACLKSPMLHVFDDLLCEKAFFIVVDHDIFYAAVIVDVVLHMNSAIDTVLIRTIREFDCVNRSSATAAQRNG